MIKLADQIVESTRDAWRLPAKITVSEWADDNRRLDAGAAESGKWRTSRTPYLRGIMDAFTEPMVRNITIMAPTQVGKTESLLNMMGYVIDQDPGPTMWVSPEEKSARKFSKTRIHPMMRSSPSLKRHLPRNEDDFSRLEIYFDRMFMFMAWSNSPSALSSTPIKYLFFDEIDKYPAFSGREADPISLAGERTSTYWDHKIVKCSTPTTREGYIYREYQLTDRCQYYLPCPHCGEYQVLAFGQVRWPKDMRDPEQIKIGRLAWYECVSCAGKITDNMKFRMNALGVWVPEGCTVNHDGEICGEIPSTTHRGFWINALYSPWRTFSDVAAKFLRSKDDPAKLMNFVNSWLAEIWEEKAKETKVDHVKSLSLDYPEGQCVDRVLVLTAGVDVQKGYMRVIIRGWGYGEENWLIRVVEVSSWADVENTIINTAYPRVNEDPLQVRLACIDTGYRTDEVYDFCRRFPDRCRPIKGDVRLGYVPFTPKRIERFPNGVLIPGGLTLYRIDPDYFKDKIHRMVHAERDAGCQWHNFANTPERYLREFCSEDKVIIRDKKTKRARETWQPRSENTPNHYWDCEVYAAAAAEMLGVQRMAEDQSGRVYEPKKSTESTYMKSVRARAQSRKGWIRRG